jgi:hypothetical protein
VCKQIPDGKIRITWEDHGNKYNLWQEIDLWRLPKISKKNIAQNGYYEKVLVGLEFAHLPVKSVFNFSRETDPMGKFTSNVQILESTHLEGTQFISGGIQTDP